MKDSSIRPVIGEIYARHIWRLQPLVQVLVIARFERIDVTDINSNFMNCLPREQVLKRLLSVYDKEPYASCRTNSKDPYSPLEYVW
ncbi:unnamed protein product [Adineta ricciae]|uniref:Uncharacterized protein n=1 Tax=Adineta ricciae TaxID=249248 RepID=A0A816E5C7_ADIRI|nr:unnamed protein product [Adineta ricciae]